MTTLSIFEAQRERIEKLEDALSKTIMVLAVDALDLHEDRHTGDVEDCLEDGCELTRHRIASARKVLKDKLQQTGG